MLWQVIPQPNCAGEEGVEVEVNRGLGNLKITLLFLGLVALPIRLRSSSGILMIPELAL